MHAHTTCMRTRMRTHTRTHTHTTQIMYRLADGCSINQAEQLAVVKALEKLQDFRHIQGLQRSAAVHTDSKISLDAIANPRNHQHLVEQIREGVSSMEKDN